MRVKITSSGTVHGTTVTTEDGRNLTDKLKGVSFQHSAGELPTAELEISLIEIEVMGRAVLVGPDGRHICRIEYIDGTVDEF